MKAIIDGKRYDTGTATKVAGCGSTTGSFNDYNEALYVTRNGSWFLAGSGGPASRYAQRCGDMWGSGSGIKVLTPEEAREWLERNDETDLIEEHFSDSVEDA